MFQEHQVSSSSFWFKPVWGLSVVSFSHHFLTVCVCGWGGVLVSVEQLKDTVQSVVYIPLEEELLLNHFSSVQLCATPWMAAHQAPPSLGCSRQEHWSGLPFPSPMHESEK